MTETIKVRIRPADKKLLDIIAQKRGCTIADTLGDLIKQELAEPMLERFAGQVAKARRFVPDMPLIRYTNGQYLALDEDGTPYYRRSDGSVQYLGIISDE